ncbi:YbjN domain-containing protein [Paracoccus sp. (in: a-proteobacteria)]|uniref:YbjN domain-containing protein n=1 Tax=Paracoccus sp. TaxID=267 RepID=UPI00321F7DA8
MRILSFLALAVLLQAPAAHAQVRGDAAVIVELMQDFGLPATLETDTEGDPMIDSRIDGTHFSVYFYQCDPICASVQLSAGFDLARPLPLERVNEWNRDRRFGKVFVDSSGDPFIEMDIGLADDGVGRKNFDDALETWRVLLSEFRDFIDW